MKRLLVALLVLAAVGFLWPTYGQALPARNCPPNSNSPQCQPTTVPTTTTTTTTVAPSTTTTTTSPETTSTSTSLSPTSSTTSTTTSSTTTSTTAPVSGGFPDASNTGVPAGVTLTPYTGPCTITTSNTVIDAKAITCSLSIYGQNVQINRSTVRGIIRIQGGSLTMTDSEIDGTTDVSAAISYDHYSLYRVEIRGARLSSQCDDTCLVQDSWLHGQYMPVGANWHMDGFASNGGSGMTLRHNRIACDRPGEANGACSAPIALYGDFAPIQNVLIENNLVVWTPGSYCMYGGTDSKPYGGQAANIVVRNNVFQRGPNGLCGFYGPLANWSSTRPGNVWSGNVWDDGAVLDATNVPGY